MSVLNRLPPEIRSHIFDIYILSSPLSSHYYQDILCLDRQTYNRAVIRLYDKVTLHANNVNGYFAGLEDTPVLQRHKDRDNSKLSQDEKKKRRIEEIEALISGAADYHHSETARYPKHYLIRRTMEITFQDPSALMRTGQAAMLLCKGHPPDRFHSLPKLFQPVPDSKHNVRLIFPRSVAESTDWGNFSPGY
ncbi:hypothetical protein IAT38_005460 [Cryptococcus sp. DSM 104549]